MGLQDPKREWTNFDDFTDLQNSARSLQGVAAFTGWSPILSGASEAERLTVASPARWDARRGAAWLGDSGQRLFGEVLRWAFGMAAVGTAFGLLGLLALRPLLGGFLHTVSPWDPASLLGACLLLVLAVLLAATGPARRAQRVDPLQSLRAD